LHGSDLSREGKDDHFIRARYFYADQ
jgi:hypothetical protein